MDEPVVDLTAAPAPESFDDVHASRHLSRTSGSCRKPADL